MNRRAFLVAAATLSTPVVAGCAGGDGGGGGEGTDQFETTAGTTTVATGDDGGGTGGTPTARTPTPGEATGTGAAGQAAYPGYDWEQLTRADAAETDTVTMRDTVFHPLVAKVAVGTEVAFPNEDPSVHTVTVPALDVDELVRAGERTSIAFEEPGPFDYVCTFHPPGMLGRVVVE